MADTSCGEGVGGQKWPLASGLYLISSEGIKAQTDYSTLHIGISHQINIYYLHLTNCRFHC